MTAYAIPALGRECRQQCAEPPWTRPGLYIQCYLASSVAAAHALQLTYEGLLDEVFGLSCGQLRAPDTGGAVSTGSGEAGAGGASSGGGTKKVYGLNSADAVFRETRDQFYVGARKWLNETLR